MSKFINRYARRPTLANRCALQNYLKKHPMAIVMASKEEIDFLLQHSFSF